MLLRRTFLLACVTPRSQSIIGMVSVLVSPTAAYRQAEANNQKTSACDGAMVSKKFETSYIRDAADVQLCLDGNKTLSMTAATTVMPA